MSFGERCQKSCGIWVSNGLYSKTYIIRRTNIGESGTKNLAVVMLPAVMILIFGVMIVNTEMIMLFGLTVMKSGIKSTETIV